MPEALGAGASIGETRAALTQRFRAAGLETPELDARLLIGHALSLDHAALTSSAGRALNLDERTAIEALAVRRLCREPVSRIVGMKEFWSLPFQISPAVLVPRPETETLVECALAWTAENNLKEKPLRILDIGTGSGALLCALLSEFPNATGVATDFSNDALAVARRNARALGFAARTKFILCDIASEVRDTFDLVVSNPPYIASSDIETLPPEVREHDPRMALDGGADGLAAYAAISVDASRLLKPDGRLVLELGAGQADAVRAMFIAARLKFDTLKNDLAGVPRALMLSA